MKIQTLDQIERNKNVQIKKMPTIDETSTFKRLMEMGLTEGSVVSIKHLAPFGGTIAVECRGTLIAIRIDDAKFIEVLEVGADV